jgi:hypothetical protein
MAELTSNDIFELLTELNKTLQPAGQCVATPKKMRSLLERLQEYTDAVQAARKKNGLVAKALVPSLLPGAETMVDVLTDVSVPQWRRDMANWQYRMGEYFRALEEVPSEQEDTVEGCQAIYTKITGPLLDGIYYQIMPGIVLSSQEKARILSGQDHPENDVTGEHPGGHSNRKPPDVITPFTLGNQIIIYQDFQKENLRRLIEDLTNPPLLRPDEWPWWVTGLVIAGAGVVVGIAGLYVYNLLPKPQAQNPRQKRARLNAEEREIGSRYLPADWQQLSNAQRLALANEMRQKARTKKLERNGDGPTEEELGYRYAARIVRETLPAPVEGKESA